MSDKYKNIDDLFRDKFKDFEPYPPDHIWGNINTQMHGADGKGGKGGNLSNGGIYGITIILILSTILTWYLLSSNSNKNYHIPKENITLIENTEYKSSTRTVSINQNITKESSKNSSNKANNSSSKPKNKQEPRFDISEPATIFKGKTSLIVKENITSTFDAITDNQSSSKDLEYIDDVESLTMLSPGDDDELLALHQNSQSESADMTEIIVTDYQDGVDSQNSNVNNVNIEPTSSPESAPELKSDYGHKGNWAFGLFFTPEMIFYPDNNDLNNRSYALDVNAIYKFSGYLLQSGLGINWTSDEGNCEIDYNKYLGSYEDVYNVTFDTIGNEITPVYHTETVKVYDSIDHVSIMPTKNHYTYLQIPLLFGYGSENRRFGWFVKGGPSLSIMIHENVSSNMSDTDDKILSIENEIPSRINTNWQFVFTGGISYKLSNHLSFTAEPIFRYYLNSTYEKNKLNLKNPYSLGLRVGFLVDL